VNIRESGDVVTETGVIGYEMRFLFQPVVLIHGLHTSTSPFKEAMTMPDLRLDIRGLRVRLPGSAPVYLIDLGKKRHIPDPNVYNELFSTWDGIIDDLDVDDIAVGEPIPETAILFRCSDSPKVFLLDGIPPHQTKRHIASPAVMDRYKFNWARVHLWTAPLSAIGYPDGPEITNP
jgi:hypothetical protein